MLGHDKRIVSLEKEIKILAEIQSGVKFDSESRQDLKAWLFFKGKKDGFYIDVGANDGVSGNNTYALEQLGWKGICVEPQPDIFLQLQKNRTCEVCNAALSKQTNNEAKFAKVSGPGIVNMYSGLDSEMTEVHKQTIKKLNGIIEYIDIKTLSFNDLMKNHPGINYIDFMSIDAEGGEMSILQAIDFTRFHFGLITIENNSPDDVLVDYMQQNSYVVYDHANQDVLFVPAIKK
jgi:FkbM family methyltransferase